MYYLEIGGTHDNFHQLVPHSDGHRHRVLDFDAHSILPDGLS